MLNKVILNGRITKDLELNSFKDGNPYTNFSIAVERNYKDQSGERQTDFINIYAKGKRAETIVNLFQKGDGIIIDGELQQDRYRDKDGNNRVNYQVVVNSFDFAVSTKFKGNGQQNNQSQSNNTQQQPNDPFADNSIDIQDDDLPF